MLEERKNQEGYLKPHMMELEPEGSHVSLEYNPKGPRTQITGFWGPNTINSPETLLFGSLDPQGKAGLLH